MTLLKIAGRSLVHYRRTHAAVAMGVAAAVAVLAGSLLVGASVRESLRTIAGARLGATSVVVANTFPFTESLADRVGGRLSAPVAPMFTLTGTVAHEPTSRRAGAVNVYAIDDRFFRLHRVQAATLGQNEVWLSEDLATDLGAKAGDAVVIRLPKPTDIPIDSLHGRRDEAGRSIRLSVAGTLGRAAMGEFSLAPGQGPVRSAFISLARLQRDLDLDGRINTLLIADPGDAAGTGPALASSMTIADLGLTVAPLDQSDALVIESTRGLIPDAVGEALTTKAAGAGLATTPILTWLANRLIAADGLVPYSLVSAIGPDAGGDARIAQWLATPGEVPPIVLNEWTARELRAQPGTIVNLEYFKWLDSGQLVTEHASFRVAGTIPMTGLGVDRRLAPDYPGITTATGVADWDPPFPIDLGLVRPQDEAYWRAYRTASKALIPLAAGQSLWRSRHGQLTSIRVRTAAAPGSSTPLAVAALTDTIVATVDPSRAGFTVVDVRQQSAAASAGSTDFGAYFSYFSAFLMISALLLAALFFRLGIEQRLSQIGVLRATGYTLAHIRRLFLIEATVVITAGAAAGVVMAVGWAALMMFALRTWWIGAVGTTQLQLHIDATSLMLGSAGASESAVIAIAWTIRSLNKATPRALLSGSRADVVPAKRIRGFWLAPIALLAAGALSALALMRLIPAAGAFFGAGALILVAGLAAFRRRLTRPSVGEGTAIQTVSGLGVRNASWRPGRSVTVAGLVSAAVFLLVSVDAFRKNAGPMDARDSGTGGFALIAESAIPIVHDLQTHDGRLAAGLTDASGGPNVDPQIFGLRLRPGDDASCVNLFQPRHPRIAGVPDALVREARFTFARSVAKDAAALANPWTLLGPPADDGAVPAIVDATSLEYVLHASVGDILTVDADTTRPIRMRIVGSLADSVLQGEILIAESAFRYLFPDLPGYRLFLVSVPQPTPERVEAATVELERSLDSFGFDAEETTRRLAAFHRVENTYLSTFQALGGLGLMLGCLGVVAVVLRNVLERRRELALLGAAGFTGADLQRLIAMEHVTVIGAGLVIGLVAAAVAVAPVVASRGGGVPWHALVWIVPVALAGLAAAVGATRSLRRLPLVPSLRSE
jgi:ABC-type antimicrobial peptide transport system permease subunit